MSLSPACLVHEPKVGLHPFTFPSCFFSLSLPSYSTFFVCFMSFSLLLPISRFFHLSSQSKIGCPFKEGWSIYTYHELEYLGSKWEEDGRKEDAPIIWKVLSVALSCFESVNLTTRQSLIYTHLNVRVFNSFRECVLNSITFLWYSVTHIRVTCKPKGVRRDRHEKITSQLLLQQQENVFLHQTCDIHGHEDTYYIIPPFDTFDQCGSVSTKDFQGRWFALLPSWSSTKASRIWQENIGILTQGSD